MVGHVQSRKARDVVQHFQVIHSLDSLKLARRYQHFAEMVGVKPTVLLQVNVSGEASKTGIAAERWQDDRQQREHLWTMVQSILEECPMVTIVGLMTMAPFVAEAEATRPDFAALRQLRDALAADFPQTTWHELSMGMTNDYTVAIEEGATLVRIGRAIFGERPV
jgi:hypothetical protein